MGDNMSNCHVFENSNTCQVLGYLRVLELFSIKCSHNKDLSNKGNDLEFFEIYYSQ